MKEHEKLKKSQKKETEKGFVGFGSPQREEGRIHAGKGQKTQRNGGQQKEGVFFFLDEEAKKRKQTKQKQNVLRIRHQLSATHRS